jgi:hypothetical protein
VVYIVCTRQWVEKGKEETSPQSHNNWKWYYVC